MKSLREFLEDESLKSMEANVAFHAGYARGLLDGWEKSTRAMLKKIGELKTEVKAREDAKQPDKEPEP